MVRNRGNDRVYWQAGGCVVPVQGVAGPASVVSLDLRTAERARWDGEVGGLAGWLADHNTLSPSQPHQAEDATGIRDRFCHANSRLEPLLPGDELRHGGSVELRVPPGPLPDEGDYLLLVAFQPYVDRAQYPHHAMPRITARALLTVGDDPTREPAGQELALGAFETDTRFDAWIASTALPHRPDLTQDFDTELSWWRGAWELWVSPHWSRARTLRMRYDPVVREIVDVRTVYLGQSPADEPGAVLYPGNQPDDVIEPDK